MKTMYKVIVAMMIMAITAAPAVAGNNVDRNTRPYRKEMRTHDRKHNRRMDRHHDRHHADIDVVTFRVSPRASHRKNVVAAARSVYGVKDVRYNPHTNMMTVTYDANKTSPRTIKAVVN